jgi:transposase
MNAVGIDVSKGKSVVAIHRPLGEVISKPFAVRHTTSELKELADSLKSLDGETKVIMEHTGRYYEPVAQMLHDAGIFVSAVNPKLIKGYGNNSLRKVRTDKADSRKIARYGLDNWAELRQHTSMDTIRYQLKMMNRQYSLYTKHKTAIKNNLIALLDQSYPGANALFSSPAREDGSQKWVDFVASFWHVDCVTAMSQAAFSERYRKWCKRLGYNFSAVKVDEIHAGAKTLIAMLPKDTLTKLLIQEAITQLNSVSKTVALLRTEMNNLAERLPEYPVVMSMYGVGDSLGPQLLAEIGDVTRFAHKGSLAAFAGVDPGANQSGSYEAKSTPASKRGSPELRKTLFLVMDVLVKNAPLDDAVFQFIDKKRTEGKPYYVYMTAGANKFLRVYYGKVKEHLASLVATE